MAAKGRVAEEEDAVGMGGSSKLLLLPRSDCCRGFTAGGTSSCEGNCEGEVGDVGRVEEPRGVVLWMERRSGTGGGAEPRDDDEAEEEEEEAVVEVGDWRALLERSELIGVRGTPLACALV